MRSDAPLEIDVEMARQYEKWGEQNHPDGTGRSMDKYLADGAKTACEEARSRGQLTWRHILDEEVREAFAETDLAKLRAELVQVGAVAASWIEAIDRRQPPYLHVVDIYINGPEGTAQEPVASITLDRDQYLTYRLTYEGENANTTDAER